MSFIEQFEQHRRRREAEAKERSRFRAQTALLEPARLEHAATGNPLAVWAALRLARRSGLPVPEWVLAYFHRFARVAREWQEKPPAGDLARVPGVVLGFGSARKDQNPMTDWRERREGEK